MLTADQSRAASDLLVRHWQEGTALPQLPESRFTDYAKVGPAQLIADNACAHRFVLGPQAPDAWRGMDLAAHRVVGAVAGRLEREGRGANVLGDPRLALTWLANELSRH